MVTLEAPYSHLDTAAHDNTIGPENVIGFNNAEGVQRVRPQPMPQASGR